MSISAALAESAKEKMWTLSASVERTPRPAEKRPILRWFSLSRLTGFKKEDCYTFQRVASIPCEIRTAYYYHYKEKRLGLKEETTWS